MENYIEFFCILMYILNVNTRRDVKIVRQDECQIFKHPP